MTGVLSAAVIVVAVVTLLNLVFTLAVVRRLREHTTALATLNGVLTAPPSGPPPGSPVPAVSGLDEGEWLLAFVSATCGACRRHLPGFTAAATGARALVVVSGDDARGADLVRMAEGVARVVTEPDDGPWTSAFDIHVFPTFVRVAGGTVQAVGPDVADILPAPVPG
jgi:hypothetical protein